MNRRQLLEIFEKNGLPHSRMISGSKTFYMAQNPTHQVVFNASIYEDGKSIWWGDLDLTLDSEKLQNIVKELNTNLHVVREGDARHIGVDFDKSIAVKSFNR